ncbi:methyl-accepting chemotaxis protein [Carboxydothermus ferrireducens]|uniref:Methyl-accepting chemotaxis protein n=1 Tax=Carboxydothermus ferrireducens DSM 11255 TaxID=1119529 RepID=A0ABX2R6J3_9THEO|nr:methyl-accepting chemotaxis protein [Carboxydothermus ferrireducens]NYE56791.1 methyl-accepting chemotaxis protein [Carboxydothermus ferrireducens DSM 11255]
MSIKKLLFSTGIANILILVVIFAFFLNYVTATDKELNKIINVEQALLINLNEMYAQGLQTGQATRNIILNPKDENARKNYDKAHEAFIKANEEAIKLASGTMKQDLEKVRTLWEEDHQLKVEAQKLAISGKTAEAVTLHAQKETPKWRVLKEILLKKAEEQKSLFKKHLEKHEEKGKKQSTLIGIIILFSIFLSVLTMILTIRKVAKPLTDLTAKVDQIAKGDLSVTIDYDSKDEVGILASSMNVMVQSFSEIATQIKEKSTLLTKESENLSATSEEMAASAQEVAKAMQQVSAGASTQAQDLTNIAALTENTATKANAGKKEMDNLVKSIQQIKSAFELVVEKIKTLAASIMNINNVTNAITEISDQTNLLALNAAIEAVRAGEAGKGFAVVAEEVRKLAEKSKSSTDEITKIILSVQNDANEVIKTSDNVDAFIKEQIKAVESSVLAFGDILQAVDEIADKIQQVSAVTEESSAAAEEVAATSEELSASSEELAAIAQNLNLIATDMENTVNKFKV